MQIKILIVCLFFSHLAFGQFVAGKKMLQGDFNLGISVNGNDKTTTNTNTFNSRDIRVGIGSQIAYIENETRQWGFGGNFSFADNANKSTNKNSLGSTLNTNHSIGFSFSPTIFRTHLKKLMPNLYGGFRYYGSIGYSTNKSSSTNEFTSTVSQPASTASSFSLKQNSVNAGIGLTSQFYYFITQKWGLSANIGYLDMSFVRDLKSKNWSFNTYSGFNNFGFGLFKILDK
jgi:hypothetical protein